MNRNWRRGLGVLVAAAACAAAAAGRAQDHAAHPAVQLATPEGEARTPRATVTIAGYRYDDILWENDRTAHRIYGHALEAAEPPSGSGIDAWGKAVRWPYMDRQLHTGDQHGNHGEGLDFYNVGEFRGAGGLGVWDDNKLWVSRNYTRVRILENGPRVARFEVGYAPWPVGTERKVWETRRFALPLGTNFTRMVSTIASDKPGPLIVGIGIGKKTTSERNGKLRVDRERGVLTWWGPEEPGKGAMAIALLVDPKAIEAVRDDANNHLVLLRVQLGKPFVYYMGAAWSGGPDFKDAASWNAYALAQTPDFDPTHP